MKTPKLSAHYGLINSNSHYKPVVKKNIVMQRHGFTGIPAAASHQKIQISASASAVKYLPPQSDEKRLTEEIQQQNWLESFANEILAAKPDIHDEVNRLKIAQFSEYSGINQSGYLGKFFYIARYIDEVKKSVYKTIQRDQSNSPLNKGVEYDIKPWTIDWDKIPQYTKDYVFTHRIHISQEAIDRVEKGVELATINLHKRKDLTEEQRELCEQKLKKCTEVLNDYKHIGIFSAKPSDGSETSTEYKGRILRSIGKFYDNLPCIDKGEEKIFDNHPDKNSLFAITNGKLRFLKAAAVINTSSPLIQFQDNNKLYIQGYIMNVLELNSTSQEVRGYYAAAVDHNMGLLSGPSGTSHRAINLVKELESKLIGNLDLLKLKTTALCLAALGVPYNNHSFYEIVTVVLPDNVDLHNVEKFRMKLQSEKLLPASIR